MFLPCMALFFYELYRAGLLTIQRWYDLILHNCPAGRRNHSVLLATSNRAFLSHQISTSHKPAVLFSHNKSSPATASRTERVIKRYVICPLQSKTQQTFSINMKKAL